MTILGNGDDDAYDDSYVHESNVDYYGYFHLLLDVQSICNACDDCDYFVDWPHIPERLFY